MKSKITIIIYSLACFIIALVRMPSWKDHFFVFDRSGYHLYLPATIIYNDLGQLKFFSHINHTYSPSGLYNWNWYAIYDQPNGRRVNRYPVGVAIMEAPFFIAAHGYTLLSKQYPADGYSLPYQWGTILSNIFWVALGLYFLSKLLRLYFENPVIALTLFCIAFGTNLFHQNSIEQGGSHIYTFCLLALLLYLTDHWYRSFHRKHILLIGVTLGMIILVRPVNIVMITIPLLWRTFSYQTIKARLNIFSKEYSAILFSGITMLLIASLQLLYWRYTTGLWLYDTYPGESFDFSSPNIINGLFSYRKGWFLYTPIAAIAFIGFYHLRKKQQQLIPSIILFYAMFIYIVFSWREWWYGGTFGSRVMIDTLPLLSIPFAALVEHIYRKSILKKVVFALAVSFFILLNLFQTYQYVNGIIHWDRMTKAYYWRVFAKTSINDSDKQLLLKE